METPLMVLQCLSAQLELYADHVIFRPMGTWAWISRMVEQNIPFKDIESVRLLENNPHLSGVMEIKRRETHPRSIYILYSHANDHKARTFYEALDDLLTRKDVLNVVKTLEHS